MAHGSDRLRLDKWLWHARFCKSRGLAAEMVSEGRVRINGQPCAKPGRAIGPGDVLTFGLGGEVMVVRILACGTRRGPATEAATLWEPLGETKRPAAAPPPEQAF